MKAYKNKLVFFLIIFIFGCSTEKNNFLSRSYHNLTAKYNAYFNGNESFKEGAKKVATNFKDNYTQILPVFTYSDKTTNASATSNMETAITKASKVIAMHSIKSKPRRKNASTKKQKEFMKKSDYCKWVDDSYLLMGKANFYKMDYYAAAENFEYVITKFSQEPTKYIAMLWLARNNNELSKFDETKQILDQLDGDRKFPKKYRGEIAAIYADYYLKQKKYEDAIPHLRVAIEKGKKKKDRARYKYILAQIYQNIGESTKATRLFAEVIKMNPNYEMVFNAQVSRATSFELTAGSSKEIKKQLGKMIRDEKNKEYLDQLYYALANINFKEGNESEALENYKLSAEKSVDNQQQKAISYLAVADIYYSKPKYKEAQAYYDSTMTILSADFPGYDKLYLKTQNLTELVKHIDIISYEDSVQTLAKMTEKDRNKIIDDIIEKIKEEEQKALEEQREQQINSMIFNQNQNQNRNNTNSDGSGKWYFYNQGMLSVGMSEFKRKWGTRKLEDNWRRKNKAVVIDQMAENSEQGSESLPDSKNKNTNTKSREYYLQNIPLTDSMMTASTEKVIEAYFNLGKCYKELFLDYNLAIKTFEEFIKLYPENEYLLSTYYYLYQLYVLNKNTEKADYYKNLIINKFPDSKYTKVLLDPNYIKETESKLSEVSSLYDETYGFYQKSDYKNVIEKCMLAESSYSDNIYTPQFKFLKAVATGKISGPNAMVSDLKAIISDYPNSEVSTYAKDVLTKMKDMDFTDNQGNKIDVSTQITSNENIETEKDTVPEIYKLTNTETQFYILIVESKNVDVNRLKFNIENYNSDKYNTIDFNLSDVPLSETQSMITVKSFNGKENAMKYYEDIKNNNSVFKNISDKDISQFIISSTNYTIFFADRDVKKYMKFFKNNYQNN